MSPRARWTLSIFALIAVIAAGALFYPLTRPTQPPLPSEQVEQRSSPPAVGASGVADPAGMAPSAQNELECVDRLLRNGSPADADPKAEWERCAALGEAARGRAMPDDPQLELDGPVTSNGAEMLP